MVNIINHIYCHEPCYNAKIMGFYKDTSWGALVLQIRTDLCIYGSIAELCGKNA